MEPTEQPTEQAATTSKGPVSFRLSAEGRTLLAEVAKKLGISKASALEIAIRGLAKKEGIRT